MTGQLVVLTIISICVLSSTPSDAATGYKTLEDYLSNIFDHGQLAFDGVKLVAVDIVQNTTSSIFSFFQIVMISNQNDNVRSNLRIFMGPKIDDYGDETDIIENYKNFLALGSWDIDLTPGVNVIKRIDTYFDITTLLPQRMTTGGIEAQFLFMVNKMDDKTNSIVNVNKGVSLIDWSKLRNAHFEDFKICYFE